jgi:hypothetical protein
MAIHLKTLSSVVKKTGVKGYLHTHLPTINEHRGYFPLHASDLTKEDKEFCAREACLMIATEAGHPAEVIKTSLSYTFLIGRLIERELRNVWLKKIAWGRWDCPTCGHVIPWGSCPDQCSQCGTDSLYIQYEEVPFEVVYEEKSEGKPFGVVCSPDILVALPEENSLTLVEVKSMDKDMFRGLKAPLAEHRIRTNLYLRLIEESKSPRAKKINLQKASILYVCKGYGVKDSGMGLFDGGFSPFKEYPVHRDDEATEVYLDKVREIVSWRESGDLPSRICTMPSNSRAKICSAKTPCFAGGIL